MPCLGQVGGKQRQVGEELYNDGGALQILWQEETWYVKETPKRT